MSVQTAAPPAVAPPLPDDVTDRTKLHLLVGRGYRRELTNLEQVLLVGMALRVAGVSDVP